MIVNKKIFINAQWYDPSFPTGIGSYFERLIDKTSDLSENKITIFHSGIKKFQNYKNVEEKESINILSSSYKKILWENINLPIYIFKDNPSIFYSINFSIPFILPKNLRVIATVYDLIWYLFPQYFPRTTVKAAVCRIKRTISRSNIIVTDSENTKKDLMQYFKCPLEKIRVVYPGIDIKKYCNIDSEFTKRVFKKYNISCQYFVWVGDPRPTKNIIRLCEAFREAGLRAMLYIIGPENHRFSELKKYYRKNKEIVFLNNINNEELKVFYSKSIALLFPSLYEGFGIPVLEAMASKTLVITSNISSLPEVGGEYAFYVDPYKINSIIEKLKKVINLDNKTREDLLEKQLNYISNKFSLEKMQKYFKELV